MLGVPYEECSIWTRLLVWAKNKDNLLNWSVGYRVLRFSHLQYNLVFDPHGISIKATPIHVAARMQQREMVKWFKFFPTESFQLIDVQK